MRVKVTDPCYIIDSEEWSNICDKADKMAGDYNTNFDTLVTEYLQKKTGKDWAVAGATLYGDWENAMYGVPVIDTGSFYADAGMWCVVPAEFNERPDMKPDVGALLEFDDNSPITVKVTNDNNRQWAEIMVAGVVNDHPAYAESESYDEGEF